MSRRIMENASLIFWAAILTTFLFYAKSCDDEKRLREKEELQCIKPS